MLLLLQLRRRIRASWTTKIGVVDDKVDDNDSPSDEVPADQSMVCTYYGYIDVETEITAFFQ